MAGTEAGFPWLKSLASVAALLYLVVCFSSGMDRVSARTPGVERVVPERIRADAARSAAYLHLFRNDPKAALPQAVRAVRHDPVEPHSAAILATTYLELGEYAKAEKAFRVAALFGWRDMSTQFYWYGVAMEVNDFRVAADRADAILRSASANVNLDELLAPLEVDPRGRKALAAKMRENPGWIVPFLNVTAKTETAAVDLRLATLAEANSTGFAFGCDAIQPMVRGLLSLERHGDAVTTWNNNCPQRKVGAGLVDNSFATIDTKNALPFGWTTHRSGDVSISRTDSSAGSGLSITNRASVAKLAMSQKLSLPQGRYRVKVATGGGVDSGQSMSRLAVTLGCGWAAPAPHSRDFGASDIILVADDCPQQTISIWISAGPGSAHLTSIDLAPVR